MKQDYSVSKCKECEKKYVRLHLSKFNKCAQCLDHNLDVHSLLSNIADCYNLWEGFPVTSEKMLKRLEVMVRSHGFSSDYFDGLKRTAIQWSKFKFKLSNF